MEIRDRGERKFAAKGIHGFTPHNMMMPDFWDLYLSSPAEDKGIVYFGSGDGNLYALDGQTGARKWKFATQEVVHSLPALVDGVVYIGNSDTYLYALDAITDAKRWKFKTGEDELIHKHVGIQSSPAVAGGVVYFGCRGANVYAVDAQSGTEKWHFSNSGSWVNNSPAVHDGVVYFGTSIPSFIRAVNTSPGKERFHLDAQLIIFASPASAGEMAYFGSFNGKLYAVDLKTGKFAWEWQADAGKQNALGVIGPDGSFNNKVVFSSDCYEDMYQSGAKLFSLGSILSSPVVGRGVIYVGGTDGNVYALE